jgi:ubiquitin-conjugating enzyme E2 Z
MSYDIISNETKIRLIKDIKQVIKEDISKDGIYYIHDETDILTGYALIIGPPDTPYEYGNFLFKFKFPNDYPYSPPQVSYLTNDGKTRFHPNLYKNEKVCLSVLNTWRGEGWTSCLNIKSILLILQSILDNKPLCHEPGITEKHADLQKYNDIIKYRTIDIAIIRTLNKDIYPEITEMFWSEILQNFINNYDKILRSFPIDYPLELSTGVYSLSAKLNYNGKKESLKKIYKKYKN